jgi:hypothetical protein
MSSNHVTTSILSFSQKITPNVVMIQIRTQKDNIKNVRLGGLDSILSSIGSQNALPAATKA